MAELRPLAVIAVASVAVTLAGWMPAGSSAVVVALWLALVWIPGRAVFMLARIDLDSVCARIGAPLVAGLALASATSALSGLVGVALGVWSMAWCLVSMAAATWLVFRNRWPAGRDWAWLSVTALGLVAVGLTFSYLQRPLSVTQDALDHIGYIRQMIHLDTISPPGVLAPLVSDGAVVSDPRKGGFHAVVALITRLVQAEPHAVWHVHSSVLALGLTFMFAAFVSRFVSGAEWWLAVVMFVLFHEGLGLRFAESVTNGQNIAVSFYWLMATLVLTTRVKLWLVVLLALAAATVHVGAALHLGLLGATLFLLPNWTHREADTRKSGAIIATAAGVALVVAWIASAGADNPIHSHPQGRFYLFGNAAVVSPLEVVRQYGLMFWCGVVLTPVLWWWAFRTSLIGVRRMAALTVLPLLFAFFPPLVSLLSKASGYLVMRLLLNIPALVIVAAAVGGLVRWARRQGVFVRAVAATLLLSWAMLFVVPSRLAVARDLKASHPTPIARQFSDVITFVRGLPRGSTVLTDATTSYWLSAFCDQRVVAVLEQHGSPRDPHAYRRLAAVRDALLPSSSQEETIRAVRDFGVDVVLVNGRMEPPLRRFLEDWDASDARMSANKFDALNPTFTEVFESAEVWGFKVSDADVDERRWFPAPLPFAYRVHGEQPSNCDARDAMAPYAVAYVDVNPPQVIPGEPVTITLGFRKNHAIDYTRPPVVYVRMDHESLTGPGWPGEKLMRRRQERASGVFHRLRADRRPFSGRAGLDLWPEGTLIYDSYEITVPRHMALGTYQVQVKPALENIVANFHLSDLLFNRDQFSGTACASLQISDRMVRE